MTEDRHLFLDLDGLLEVVRTRTKLQSVGFGRGFVDDDLRLNAKWLTAFLSGQTSATVATRRVTFADWDDDGVEAFIKLGWQEKSKGNRRDHLSLNTLLRANLKTWGPSNVSPVKTLALAIGDPTESVLKCVASYLEMHWSVELYCMKGVWNGLSKKMTMRCRSFRSFKNVFLDGFDEQLVLGMPSGICMAPEECDSALKLESTMQLRRDSPLSRTSSVPESVVAEEQSKLDKSVELIELAGAKLEASLSAQLGKHIRDAVAAFQQNMLVQVATPTPSDNSLNKSQLGISQEERHWILPRQTIATASRTVKAGMSNQEEHSTPITPNMSSSANATLPTGNVAAVELLALKRQMQEMQAAFSALSMDLSSQSALRQENLELRQRLEQQTCQMDQLQSRMNLQLAEGLQLEEQYEAEIENRRESLLRRERILQCPVTQSLLETPMVTVCCGNAFSRSSLERVQSCPICRTSGIRAMQSRTMESVVEQFREDCSIFEAETTFH